MKTLDLKQNSPEWEEFRRMHIGASDSPAICGISPYKTAYQLWKEKAVGESCPPNSAMIEGMRLESYARIEAEKHWELSFTPICISHASKDYMIASLDGYNESEKISLEVKVVGDNVYDQVSKNGPLPSWIYQVNHQMECAEREKAYLFIMHRGSKSCLPFTLVRNQTIINEILVKDAEFYERLINLDPPDDTHQEREDQEWQQAADKFLRAKEESAKAEEWLKNCRQQLIDMSGNSSCRGFGVATTKYMSKGTVEYAKIPELKKIDLSLYRKPSKESWRVA